MQNKSDERRNFSIEVIKSGDLPPNHKANRLIMETPEGVLELNGNDKFVVETMKDLINANGFFAGELRKNLSHILPAEFETMINNEYRRVGLPPNFKISPPEEMLSYEEAEAMRAEIAGISETGINFEIAAAFRNRARCKYQAEEMVEEYAGEFSEAEKKKYRKGLAKAELKLLLLESELAERARANRAAGENYVFGVDKAAEGTERTAFGFSIPKFGTGGGGFVGNVFETNRNIQSALSEVEEKVFNQRSAEFREIEAIAEILVSDFNADVVEGIKAGAKLKTVSGYVKKLLSELSERRNSRFLPIGIPFAEEVKLGDLCRGNVFAFAAQYRSNEPTLQILQVLDSAGGIVETRDLIKRDRPAEHCNDLEMKVFRFLFLDFDQFEPAREKFRELPVGETGTGEFKLEHYTKEGLHSYFVQFLNGERGLASAEVLADIVLLAEAETEARVMKREKKRYERFEKLEKTAGDLEKQKESISAGKVEILGRAAVSAGEGLVAEADKIGKFLNERFGEWIEKNVLSPAKLSEVVIDVFETLLQPAYLYGENISLDKIEAGEFFVVYEGAPAEPFNAYYCVRNEGGIVHAGNINGAATKGNVEAFNAPQLLNVLRLRITPPLVPNPLNPSEPENAPNGGETSGVCPTCAGEGGYYENTIGDGGAAEFIACEDCGESEEENQKCSKCGVEVSGFGPEETPICDPCERGEPFEKHQTEIDAEQKEKNKEFGELCKKILSVLPLVGGVSIEQIESLTQLPKNQIETALAYMITGAMSETGDFKDFYFTRFENGSYTKESHSARGLRTQNPPEPTIAEKLAARELKKEQPPTASASHCFICNKSEAAVPIYEFNGLFYCDNCNPRNKPTAAERGNVTSEDVARIKGEKKLTEPPTPEDFGGVSEYEK